LSPYSIDIDKQRNRLIAASALKNAADLGKVIIIT